MEDQSIEVAVLAVPRHAPRPQCMHCNATLGLRPGPRGIDFRLVTGRKRRTEAIRARIPELDVVEVDIHAERCRGPEV